MSLQVWLPLNGDLHNQGLDPAIFSKTTENVWGSGKIGEKALLTSTGTKKIMVNGLKNKQKFSIAFWVKVDATLNFSSWSKIWALEYTNSTGTGPIRFEHASTVGNCQLIVYKETNVGENTNGYYGVRGAQNYSDNWYHITLTKDQDNTKCYINGNLTNTLSNNQYEASLGKLTGNVTIGASTCAAYLNDVRIYDHCLSPKEVEEISKGLILHYPLNNYWLAGNLLINTHFDNRLSQTTGWDTSKNGTLVANYWGGYNSGVANQATVYHAHLKEVNGEYVYEFIKDENNQWLGISQSGIQSKLTAGTKYTFSWEQYCVSGSNYVNTGLYYYKTGASSAGFHLGYGYGNSGRVIGQWQKFTYTFTAPSDADYAKNMSWYVYGAQGGNGTFYARHFKLEKGDKATSWCPAKSDTLYTVLGYNGTTIYDSSGYSNNGTIIGSLGAAAPSPRYDVATQFPGNALIEAEPLPAETKTISAWIKWNSIPSGSSGASSYTIPLHDKNSGLAIGVYNDGKALISYVGPAAGGAGSNVSCSITTNTWYHIVVVKTGDTTRDVYINNVKQSPITNNYWGGNMAKFHIGGRHLGGSYSAYLNGQIVDVRAYATALSAQQIKELYNTSMQIDSSGNVFARELVES